MSHLKDRLLAVEDDFLCALAEGEEALLSFETRWEALYQEIDLEVEAATLDPDTISLAHATALRCATLADLSIETFMSCETIGEELMGQLDILMSELHLSDDSRTPSPVVSSARRCSPTQGARKRGRDVSDSFEPCIKRQRYETPSDLGGILRSTPPASPTNNRPSPAATTLPTKHITQVRSLADRPISTKRKRCASEAELSCDFNLPKRHRVGPRLHAVSESFIDRRPMSITSSPSDSLHPACDPAVGYDPAFDSPAIELRLSEFLAPPQGPLRTTSWTGEADFVSTWPASPDATSLSKLNELDEFLSSLLEPTVSASATSATFSPSSSTHSFASTEQSSPPSCPERADSPADAIPDEAIVSPPSPSSTGSSPITPPPNEPLDLYTTFERSRSALGMVEFDVTSLGDLFSDVSYPSKLLQETDARTGPSMESWIDDFWPFIEDPEAFSPTQPTYHTFSLPSSDCEDDLSSWSANIARLQGQCSSKEVLHHGDPLSF